MSFEWSDVIGGGLGGAIGGALSYFGQQSANRANQSMANNANALTRDMQNQNLKFQERMSNTSWQRGTADMRAAGINPLLAFSRGGASTPSGSAGSGTAGVGSQNSMSGVVSALSTAKDLAFARANLENLKQDTFKKQTAAALDQASTATQIMQSMKLGADRDFTLANTENIKQLLEGLKNNKNWDASTIGKVLNSISLTTKALNPLAATAASLSRI
ncbi:MAG: DNA pilot protein [Microvirus sp.]|nr:MAG: DNA pilot protein [Microvirus sp.]